MIVLQPALNKSLHHNMEHTLFLIRHSIYSRNGAQENIELNAKHNLIRCINRTYYQNAIDVFHFRNYGTRISI